MATLLCRMFGLGMGLYLILLGPRDALAAHAKMMREFQMLVGAGSLAIRAAFRLRMRENRRSVSPSGPGCLMLPVRCLSWDEFQQCIAC